METRYQHAISLEEAVVVFSQYAHIEAQSFPVTPNPRTQHTQSRYCMMKLAILSRQQNKGVRKKFKAAASMYAWFQILLAGRKDSTHVESFITKVYNVQH